MEGIGLGETYQVAATQRRREPRPRAGLRKMAAVVLAAVGVASTAAGLIGLVASAGRDVGPLREAAMPAAAQRFALDGRAWRAVAVDDLFPPVYHSTTAAPLPGGERDFTRIGVAAPAACAAALDPALLRLLSGRPCGPVLRAGYTDATRTLVVTAGLAVLGTSPADQRDISSATQGQHDDLGASPVAFPGTPAAAFGARQRIAFRVFAAEEAPFLSFAVVGFSDGRAAAGDPGPDARDQSGAQLTAVDMEEMVDRRIAAATDALWRRDR